MLQIPHSAFSPQKDIPRNDLADVPKLASSPFPAQPSPPHPAPVNLTGFVSIENYPLCLFFFSLCWNASSKEAGNWLPCIKCGVRSGRVVLHNCIARINCFHQLFNYALFPVSLGEVFLLRVPRGATRSLIITLNYNYSWPFDRTTDDRSCRVIYHLQSYARLAGTGNSTMSKADAVSAFAHVIGL